MNFYSTDSYKNTCHEFDINFLDSEMWRGFDIAVVDSDGIRGGESIVTPTTMKDYDAEFLRALSEIDPVYKVCEFLDYHFNYYKSNHSELHEIFLKHIQYVIVPLIPKYNKPLQELTLNWIKTNTIMILQHHLEQKNEYLKKAYEIACEHAPSNPFSCNMIPIEIGKELGFDTITTKRIVQELVQEGYVSSGLGMKILMIKQAGLNYLRQFEDIIQVTNNSNQKNSISKTTPLSNEILDSIFQADENGCLLIEENDYIEYKVFFDGGSKEAKAKYCKEMAALCNNKGGYLIFGVEDNSKKLIGLQNFSHPGNAHLTEVINNYFSPAIFFDSVIYFKDGMTFFIIYVNKRRSDPSICIKTFHPILRESDVFFRYPGQSRVIGGVDKILLYNSIKNTTNEYEAEIRIRSEKQKHRPKLEPHSHCHAKQSDIYIGIKNTGGRATIHEVIVKSEAVTFSVHTPFVLEKFVGQIGGIVLRGQTKGIASVCKFEIEFIYEDAIGTFYTHKVSYNGAGGNYGINQPVEIKYNPKSINK